MRPPGTREAILQAEREILQALCRGTLEGSVKAAAMEILGSYTFQESVHQLVFETLREIPSDDPELLRAQLLVRLNNKGFPDLDLEAFFQPHALSAGGAVERMRALRATASRQT